MKKILTEEQKNEILNNFVRLALNEQTTGTQELQKQKGQMANPAWIKIKNALTPMGFKSTATAVKGSLYGGGNPFKKYDTEQLYKKTPYGNIYIKFPETVTEGGPREYDKVGVYLQLLNPEKFEILNKAIQGRTIWTRGKPLPLEGTEPQHFRGYLPIGQPNTLIGFIQSLD